MNVNEQHQPPLEAYSDADDENLQEVVHNISLHSTDGQRHAYIGKPGIVLASFEAVVMIGLVVSSFVLPHTIDKHESLSPDVNSSSLTLYAHCAVWLLVLIFDILYSRHHRQLKMNGYIRFYRSVKYLQRHPFFVKSFFQSVYVGLCNYLQYRNCKPDGSNCTIVTLKPINLLQVLTSVETAIMLIGLIIYVGRIVVHNKYYNAPDDAEDQMLASFQFHGISSNDGVGYRPDNYMDDIIENQADRIRSLQEQNIMLSKKLYLLTYRQNAKQS